MDGTAIRLPIRLNSLQQLTNRCGDAGRITPCPLFGGNLSTLRLAGFHGMGATSTEPRAKTLWAFEFAVLLTCSFAPITSSGVSATVTVDPALWSTLCHPGALDSVS
jgi:hypothetical protein